MAIVADKSGANPLAIGSYCTHTRSAADAAAVQALTPAFVGEIVFSTGDKTRYVAKGTTANTWSALTNVPIGV